MRLALDDAGFDAAILCASRAASQRARPSGCAARPCLRVRARDNCAGRGGGGTPTRRTSGLRSAPATGSRSSARRCATPAIAAPWPRPTGYALGVDRHGACTTLAVLAGCDGRALLTAVSPPDTPAWLREIPAVETVRRVWVQQCRLEEDAVPWRASDNIPGSPGDTAAHDARKATTSWVGDTVHVTEACDGDTPRRIAHVETTTAPGVDAAAHRALLRRELLPAVQLVDSGYLDRPQIVAAGEDQAIAPRGTGLARDGPRLVWERERATRPAGHSSRWRRPGLAGRDRIRVKFSGTNYGPDAALARNSRYCAPRAQRDDRRLRGVLHHRREGRGYPRPWDPPRSPAPHALP